MTAQPPNEADIRTASSQRNRKLEALLLELNTVLAQCSGQLPVRRDEAHAKVLIVGPMRSGSTMFMQWLAMSGLCAYPSNLLSRFYGAPLIGARIQQLLTDPAYNFKNEILDFNSPLSYHSENGKTRGALSPNEFWYFWRRFLPFTDLDYLPDEQLRQHAGLAGLRDELNALANVFERPFALKAMILSQNIPVLAELFQKKVFVWIRRDPIFNMQAALEARIRQYGDINTWYSFKIREYPELSKLDPLHSVAGQIHAINRSVETAFAALPESGKMLVQYEDFCADPERHFDDLKSKLASQGETDVELAYRGESAFRHTNAWRLTEFNEAEARAAYEKTSSV